MPHFLGVPCVFTVAHNLWVTSFLPQSLTLPDRARVHFPSLSLHLNLRLLTTFKGEGSWQLTMDSFVAYYLQLLFSLLNNPLFAPCTIQALKNPVSPLTLYLLHSSKNPVSLLMIYPGSYCTFCQGKPGQGMQWLQPYFFVLMYKSLSNLLYFSNFCSVIDR
jgi:hypothetical protein